MTYHDMARGKAEQIGETYALAGLKTVEQVQKQSIYAQVAAYGCRNLKEG